MKCPLCGNESFIIDRSFEYGEGPIVEFKRLNLGYVRPAGYVETLTLHCDDCGHFLFFSEDELLKRAERMK